MARFLVSANAAAAALLGILSASNALAQSCRDPDPDKLRTPIGNNKIPFHLTVENVRSARGTIVITLYGNNPKLWLVDEGSLYIYTVPANARTTSTCINLPGRDEYAIGVYHDRNNNKKIDRRKFLFFHLPLPTEDGGLSNNPGVKKAIWPELKPSLFTVNRPGMATTIRLIRPPF